MASVRARHLPLRFWIGLLIGAILLYLALRRADWPATLRALRQASVPLLGLGVVALAATFAVFAWRWRVLLGGHARVPVRDLFAHIMIGYLANAVLPLRLGDVIRAGLLGRKHGTSGTLVLASVFLERLLDVLALLVLVVALAPAVALPGQVRSGLGGLGGGALAAAAVLLLLAQRGERVSSLLDRLPSPLPPAVRDRLAGVLGRFAAGLGALRRRRDLAAAVALSALAWGIAGAGTVAFVWAFHLPAPWYAGLFVLAVVNLGGAVAPSPGGIGVYHWLAMLALSVWVGDRDLTRAYAIATHGLNLALNLALGALCLAREGATLAGNN